MGLGGPATPPGFAVAHHTQRPSFVDDHRAGPEVAVHGFVLLGDGQDVGDVRNELHRCPNGHRTVPQQLRELDSAGLAFVRHDLAVVARFVRVVEAQARSSIASILTGRGAYRALPRIEETQTYRDMAG